MTLPLPSTTNFGASYIELTIAERAMTASSLSDSAYHSRSRSSGVRAAAAGDEAFSLAEEGDEMAEMLDEVGAAAEDVDEDEDEEEDDEEAPAEDGLAYAASRRAGSSVLNLFLVRRRKYCLKL